MGRKASSTPPSALALVMTSSSSSSSSSPSPPALSPPPPSPELLHRFEADLAGKLRHLSSAPHSPNLNWLSDAMALLLSTHASATTTFVPALRSILRSNNLQDVPWAAANPTTSPDADAKHCILEHLDIGVGLLDVSNSLGAAIQQLEEHLDRLDHALTRADETACRRRPATSSGGTAAAHGLLLHSAGRRLESCLPPPPPSQVQLLLKSPRHSAAAAAAAPSSSSSSDSAITWQHSLAQAQLSLHLLKKRITSSSLPSTHCTATAALLQAWNGTTVTTALLLGALITTLMGLSTGGSGAGGVTPRGGSSWRSSNSASRQQQHGFTVSRSSLVQNLGPKGNCVLASPLLEIQRELAAYEVAEGRSSGISGQLDQVYVLGQTASEALMEGQISKHRGRAGEVTLLLVKMGISNLLKEVREMRGSIGGLRVQSYTLSRAMAAMRVSLLDAGL